MPLLPHLLLSISPNPGFPSSHVIPYPQEVARLEPMALYPRTLRSWLKVIPQLSSTAISKESGMNDWKRHSSPWPGSCIGPDSNSQPVKHRPLLKDCQDLSHKQLRLMPEKGTHSPQGLHRLLSLPFWLRSTWECCIIKHGYFNLVQSGLIGVICISKVAFLKWLLKQSSFSNSDYFSHQNSCWFICALCVEERLR